MVNYHRLGKGIVMSKIKFKGEISHHQKLIVQLHDVAKNASNITNARDAQSFCDYFVRNGYLTTYMKQRARELIQLHTGIKHISSRKRRRKIKWGEHYLYAIGNGEQLKIGYSVNPKKRISAIQTSSPFKVNLDWMKLCAYNDSDAKKQESKIHRKLKGLNVRGEWFDYKSLEICKSWRISGLQKSYGRFMAYLEYNEPERYEEIINADLDRKIIGGGYD